MGKTHSKPLAARHGRGTAWARHVMCESALTLLPIYTFVALTETTRRFTFTLTVLSHPPIKPVTDCVSG